MCGFAGFLTYGNVTASNIERKRTLTAMGRAIAHRGPDDVKYYDDGTLALVFRRLSIIDVSGGDQPFFNESRSVLGVVNGEIYNYAQLRRELGATHRFASRSDCEVPLHAYEEWGTDALSRLNGMFAIAIWDSQKKQLFLARDRLGIKPLYICHLDDGLLFASELKALLAHPQCPRELEWGALGRTPIMQHPKTSYVKGIELLPGGEFLKVTSSRAIQCGHYWRLDDHLGSSPYGLDAEAYRRRYCELLEEVTLEHMQSDVRVGLHLSGGLDSSLLAAIISRRDKDVPCFTVIERTTYRAGDVHAASELTSELGLPWHPVLFHYGTIVDELDFDLGTLEQNVWMMDSPRFDLEWLFKGELNRVARARYPNLKVLILGQGADEFAGGYSSRLTNMRSCWADYLHDEVELNLHFDNTTRNGVPSHLWDLLPYRPAPSAKAPYHKMMQLMVGQLQHHNLWHEDRSSSWHSIEARVPFLDHRVVELLASVPEALHEKLFWKKQIVRDAMHKFLPSYDLGRPKVAFFETDDGRSIELIINKIVQRIVPAFREQYMESGDFIFARDKIDSLSRRVLTRAPGYFQDATRLLECIAIAAFDRQLRAPSASLANGGAGEPAPAPLRVVQPTEWADVEAAMMSEPVMGREWNLDASVELPAGAEIVTALNQSRVERYVLTANGLVCSQIVVPDSLPWLGTFLERLGTATQDQHSIRDWINEFHVAPEKFIETLNVLNQCGFVLQDGDGPTTEILQPAAVDDQPITVGERPKPALAVWMRGLLPSRRSSS